MLFLIYRKVGVFSVFSHRPGTGLGIRSEHHFPAPSSKLCQIWLRHGRGALYLRAAVHWRGQRPPKGSGTGKTGSNLAPKHARKHDMHPPRVKKRRSLPVLLPVETNTRYSQQSVWVPSLSLWTSASNQPPSWSVLSSLAEAGKQTKQMPLKTTDWQPSDY